MQSKIKLLGFTISENFTEVSSQQRIFNPIRHIENLFDLIGFETRRNVDPYLARVNEGCLTGDLAECFKFQAFNYFSNFFDHPEYSVSDYVRIKRMSDRVVKKVYHEPYEYSGESRYVITSTELFYTLFSINEKIIYYSSFNYITEHM